MRSESEPTRWRESGAGSVFQRGDDAEADRYGIRGGDPRAAGMADGYGRGAVGPSGGRRRPADPYGEQAGGLPVGPSGGTGMGAEQSGDPYGDRTAGVSSGTTAGTTGGRPGDQSGGRASGRYGRRAADPYGRGAAGAYERDAASTSYGRDGASAPYGSGAATTGRGSPAGGRAAATSGRGTSASGRGAPISGRDATRTGREAATTAYDRPVGRYGREPADTPGVGATRAFNREETDRYGRDAVAGPYGRGSADSYGCESTDPYRHRAGIAQATQMMPRSAATVTMPETAMPATAAPPRAPAGAGGEAPSDDGTGNGLLVLILFWSALLGSVALWWFDTPGGSLHGTGAVLTAAGRITGMAAGFTLIVQVLMMSRVAWLEAWVGAHDLLRWHRSMGAYVLIMVLVHIACVVVGYADTDRTSVLHEGWTILTTFDDIVSATVATGILVAIAFTAIRAVRRRLPYELWHFLHLATYLILLLAYGHQFADGQELSRGGVAHWYWAGLYALAVACLVWGRAVEPLWFNLRHRLRVVDVVPESGDMFSIYVGGRRLDALEARAGQFFRWRFLTGGCWWQSHPFSLSAAPNRRFLRLTVGAVGDHTRRLRRLRPGTRVLVAGPSGTFTADRRTQPGALLIAGGSGIAPIRALMEEMPRGTLVLYRASSAEDLVFRAELEALAWQRGMGIQYVLGSRHDSGPRRLFTPAGMRELVPDVTRRDVYLCGPPGLVAAAVKALHRLKVPKRQIHLDPFEF